MATSPKRKIIEHIHKLFTQRFQAGEPVQWNCVLRDGELMVISPAMVLPTDQVIVDYSPGPESVLQACICRQLWTSIYQGVNENWKFLNDVDIKSRETPYFHVCK